ncbi:DUF4350 domain-containing protein [Methylophilus methylotrophus]|uniref:DUF4350 domain-containing protein n=1 Tax=Methylophilus methylotrophus TaxID=17 RepID=UPI0003660204|nr:DUF4350 domain-containing protein [Methylophilus methylotrophus]
MADLEPPYFQSKKHWRAVLAGWWQHHLAIPVLLLITILIGVVSWQFNLMADTTHNHRNTLSAASNQVLQQLPSRIEVTAFCSNSPYKGRYFRKSITALIQRYQYLHPAIDLQFIDPSNAPALARQQQIQKEGEMIIRYRGQEKRMYLPYTEEAFTNVLLQLQHGERAPVLFANGHGEAELDDTSAQGASQLAAALNNAGLQVRQSQAFELGLGNKLPTLVLAGAMQPYTATQVQAIQTHITQGGNLVWLTDSASKQGLQTIADTLGLQISQGTVIDLTNRHFDIPLHALSTQRYASQGPTQDFSLRTFFDHAHAIHRPRQYGDPWRVIPLVAGAEHGWVSHAYRSEHAGTIPAFNAETDIRGPATIALAMEKKRPSGELQRILVLGSRQFFTNAQLQRGGNLALTMQSLQWVVNNQPSISLPVTPLRDSVIALPQQQLWLILLFNSFQFGLPALLLFAGWLSWRRKHRH